MIHFPREQRKEVTGAEKTLALWPNDLSRWLIAYPTTPWPQGSLLWLCCRAKRCICYLV